MTVATSNACWHATDSDYLCSVRERGRERGREGGREGGREKISRVGLRKHKQRERNNKRVDLRSEERERERERDLHKFELEFQSCQFLSQLLHFFHGRGQLPLPPLCQLPVFSLQRVKSNHLHHRASDNSHKTH